MTDGTNPVEGSVAAEPSTRLDDPSNWDFADSFHDDEEGTTEENPGSEEIESEAAAEADETVEAEQSTQEDDEAEKPEESDEEQTEGEEAEAEPVSIKLADGTEISEDEARAGYMRDADYRRKTQTVADQRRSVEAQASRLQAQTEALADWLSQLIPAEPDINLLQQDAQAYYTAKAIRDNQLGQLQELLEKVNEPKEVMEEMTAEARQSKLQEENNLLVMAFPQTANPKGRDDFFKKANEAGQALGFSSQEMADFTDHRMFGAAYYAKLGMEAEKAKETAKRKVAAAPKAAPKKQRKAPDNRAAMRKLDQSGSIYDAMQVDFS